MRPSVPLLPILSISFLTFFHAIPLWAVGSADELQETPKKPKANISAITTSPCPMSRTRHTTHGIPAPRSPHQERNVRAIDSDDDIPQRPTATTVSAFTLRGNSTQPTSQRYPINGPEDREAIEDLLEQVIGEMTDGSESS